MENFDPSAGSLPAGRLLTQLLSFIKPACGRQVQGRTNKASQMPLWNSENPFPIFTNFSRFYPFQTIKL